MATLSDLLEWSAFSWLFFRSIGVCVFAFVSINANVFLRASIQIQVHPATKGAPLSNQNCSAHRDVRRRNDHYIAPSNRQQALPRTPLNTPPPQHRRPFDDEEYSVSPKQQQKASYTSIMSMYEEIMASDAQTIQVQQEHIQSQLEIIRSQRDMIQRLQELVEERDAWIDEYLEKSRT
ncbi:hypothetical protein BCR34DRAFT_600655 [Clohesyomyces aquaticus]|uniref:Uncharacterized protein n=1 Tax=Clohesyomyces aquaticus TaxID=1231657 RepID=A0A1Y1ZQB4_9PLEO|nr:hypothetical protein BCR34DRAFT_600655 [Clohesyomyces aquaticus]